MTTVSTLASCPCEYPQPSLLERVALTVLRALERDIEARVRRRVLTRPTRHAAERQHAEGRADASAGAHVGVLSR